MKPTPSPVVEDASQAGLTTIEKLCRVISLIHDAYAPPASSAPSKPVSEPTPARAPAASSTPRQVIDIRLTPCSYATILQLLGSAIVDLSALPLPSSSSSPTLTHPSAVSWADMCDDDSTAHPDSPLLTPESSTTVRQLLPPPTPIPLPADPRAKNAEHPNASNTFLNLPGEVHARILHEAHKLSIDSKSWTPAAIDPDILPIEDEIWLGPSEEAILATGHHPLLQPWPVWGGGDAESRIGLRRVGGRLHAQHFLHSMALVASAFVPVARKVAFERIYVRSRRQIRHLIKLWSGELHHKLGNKSEVKKVKERVDGRKQKRAAWYENQDEIHDGEELYFKEELWLEDMDDAQARAEKDEKKVEEDVKHWLVEADKGKEKLKEGHDSGEGDSMAKYANIKLEDPPGSKDGAQDPDSSSPNQSTSTKTLTNSGDGTSARSPINLGQYVLHVEIQVTIVTHDQFKDLNPNRHQRHPSGLRHSPALISSLAEIQASRQLALETEREQLVRMIRLMPNLKSLALSLLHNQTAPVALGLESGLSQIGYGLDGLEGELLRSICSLQSLTTFILRQAIDFSELVILLRSLPGLKELRFQGGVECADGYPDADAHTSHLCKLHTFVLHRPASNMDVAQLSSEQLDWILTPSVGTLMELDLAFWAHPLEEPQGWGADGLEHVVARWATNTFADLLARLGPTLMSLALRGCAYVGLADPSLQIEPHNGSLDYALSFCDRLQYLAIDFCVTGPHFLTSLTAPSKSSARSNGSWLKSITLFGRPRHTSALMLRELLERSEPVALPLLRSITLADFPTLRVQISSWPSREIRRLQEVCRERKVWFGVTN